jgi:limonene 1,2-monooxygenase
VQQEAERCGHIVVRGDWRLIGPKHVARTAEEAVRQCEYGARWQYEYFSHITPIAVEVPATTAELLEFINRTGRGAFGTPELAAQQIQRLIDRTGGFGTYLFQGADFADWRDTLRSYELFAEEVIPLFNGTLGPVQASYDVVMGRTEANRSAITAARAAAEAQWQRERRDIGTS